MNGGIAYNVFVFISKYKMNIMTIHKLTFKTVQIEHGYIYISHSLACANNPKTKHTAAFVKFSVRDWCSFVEFRTTTFLVEASERVGKYRYSFATHSRWTVTWCLYAFNKLEN